jgi:hypothetical protein
MKTDWNTATEKLDQEIVERQQTLRELYEAVHAAEGDPNDDPKVQAICLQERATELREALLSARPYVEAYCGADGFTRGMAEGNLNRIDKALTITEPQA